MLNPEDAVKAAFSSKRGQMVLYYNTEDHDGLQLVAKVHHELGCANRPISSMQSALWHMYLNGLITFVQKKEGTHFKYYFVRTK